MLYGSTERFVARSRMPEEVGGGGIEVTVMGYIEEIVERWSNSGYKGRSIGRYIHTI